MNRRRRDITVHPDGRLTDEDAFRAYLAGLERPRVRVERLSLTDSEISAFEASDRGVRAGRVA